MQTYIAPSVRTDYFQADVENQWRVRGEPANRRLKYRQSGTRPVAASDGTMPDEVSR
jgi:hypothetical protein